MTKDNGKREEQVYLGILKNHYTGSDPSLLSEMIELSEDVSFE